MALKYKEIAMLLRQQILAGIYPPDTLLPTEHDYYPCCYDRVDIGKI